MTMNVPAEQLDFVRIDQELIDCAVRALDQLKCAGLKVVTAESCTGGLIATVLSEAPGAAEHLDGGFVAYTAEHKSLALRVDKRLIDRYGAVSPEVAEAMARGALACSEADIAVSVTGVAGPEPDQRGNPIGLVYLACARRGGDCVGIRRDFGDIGRSRVRYETAVAALDLVAIRAESWSSPSETGQSDRRPPRASSSIVRP